MPRLWMLRSGEPIVDVAAALLLSLVFGYRHTLVSRALNLHFYPTIYVIDARGTIRYKNIRGEKLEAAVNKLLKEIDGDKGAAGGE